MKLQVRVHFSASWKDVLILSCLVFIPAVQLIKIYLYKNKLQPHQQPADGELQRIWPPLEEVKEKCSLHFFAVKHSLYLQRRWTQQKVTHYTVSGFEEGRCKVKEELWVWTCGLKLVVSEMNSLLNSVISRKITFSPDLRVDLFVLRGSMKYFWIWTWIKKLLLGFVSWSQPVSFIRLTSFFTLSTSLVFRLSSLFSKVINNQRQGASLFGPTDALSLWQPEGAAGRRAAACAL